MMREAQGRPRRPREKLVAAAAQDRYDTKTNESRLGLAQHGEFSRISGISDFATVKTKTKERTAKKIKVLHILSCRPISLFFALDQDRRSLDGVFFFVTSARHRSSLSVASSFRIEQIKSRLGYGRVGFTV